MWNTGECDVSCGSPQCRVNTKSANVPRSHDGRGTSLVTAGLVAGSSAAPARNTNALGPQKRNTEPSGIGLTLDMVEPQSPSWPVLQRGTCRLCAAQLLVRALVPFRLLHSFCATGMDMISLIISVFASIQIYNFDADAVAVSTFGHRTVFPLAAGTSCTFHLWPLPAQGGFSFNLR